MPAMPPGGICPALGNGMLLTAPGKCGKRCGQPPLAMPYSGPNWAFTTKSMAFCKGAKKRASRFSRYMRSMSCEATAVPASSNVALP